MYPGILILGKKQFYLKRNQYPSEQCAVSVLNYKKDIHWMESGKIGYQPYHMNLRKEVIFCPLFWSIFNHLAFIFIVYSSIVLLWWWKSCISCMLSCPYVKFVLYNLWMSRCRIGYIIYSYNLQMSDLSCLCFLTTTFYDCFQIK